MDQEKKVLRPKHDLEADALAALEGARMMPHGPERTEAMKKAGILRNAADLQGVFLRGAGGPRKRNGLPRNDNRTLFNARH